MTALERQAEALNACGINPAHVVRAALRRATKHWPLKPEFVPPRQDRTAKPSSWRMRTTVAVDAETLTAIMATEDPLDVCSKWSLIRGHLEPRERIALVDVTSAWALLGVAGPHAGTLLHAL